MLITSNQRSNEISLFLEKDKEEKKLVFRNAANWHWLPLISVKGRELLEKFSAFGEP